MKKVAFTLCALLLLVSVGIFASCGLKVGGDGTLTPIQKQLDTPSGLRVSDGNLCWNPVEYCNKYTVSIDGAEYYCNDYKYSLDGIRNGEHVFKVKANGDGVQYTSSAFSSEFRTELEGGSTVTRGYYSQFDDLSKNESFLGYGFDVINSNVFSDKYVKNSFMLFNKDQLMQQRLVKVDSKYSSVEETESTDIEEFMQEWNVKSNVNVSWGKKKIGGSVRVQAAYSGGSQTAKSKYYHCISITNQKFYIVLQSDIATYKSMLNECAANDLYSDMAPAQLFDRYGTHFITSAVMGGKINSYYLYTSEQEIGFNDVSSRVSTDFRYLVGETKVGVSGGYADYAEKNEIKIKNTLDVLGGSDFGILSDRDVGANYLNWEKSLNEHASLIGIKDSSSLVPIWELIDSEKDTRIYEWDYDGDGIIERGNRSAQLQAYFAAYGIESFNALREAAGIHEIVTPEQITNIKVNNLPAEHGEYTVYAGDLNDLSFTVLPANALGYTKTARISSECGYARINNDNGLALEIDANAPAGECIDIILSAGSVRETIKVRIQKRYTVMFHSNGGTNIDPLRNVLHGTQIDEPEQPKKRGFIFDGWYTDPDFADESMYQFGVKSIQSNLNLYAKWLPYYPIITFISNVKSIAIDSQTVKFNAVLAMPQTPYAEGYTFAGYYADAGMTSEFDFSQNIVTDTKIYVKWNINKYDVFFETNGGVAVEKQTVEYNSLVGKPTTTKVGYTFVGWYKDVDFNQVFDFNTETVKKSFTLYAKWQINKYDVFFETNGGVKIEKQTVDYNSKLEKPSVSKAGHTLIGWYKDPDFTQAYDFNAENVTGSFTLYAKWSVDRYDVFFETNGGVAVEKQTVEYNSLLENPITTKAGYEFAGWYKDPDFGQVFDFKANKVTGSFTLYAKWSKNLITVRFDTQGLADLDERKVEYDSALGVNLPECQKIGYEFKGWFKESSLETEVTEYTIFCDAEFANLSEDRVVTLYGKFQLIKSVITLDKNGGVGGFDKYYEIYNSAAYSDAECSELIVAVNIPSKAGYVFEGYYTDINDGVKAINENGTILSFVYGKETILYARWSGVVITVRFLDPQSSTTVSEKKLAYGDTYSEAMPKLEKYGYELKGWYNDSSFKTKITEHSIFSNELFPGLSDQRAVTLYGWLSPINCRVRFEPNGGSCSVVFKDIPYGSTFGEMPVATRENCDFDGWYTEDGNLVNSETEILTIEPQTVYAHWRFVAFDATLKDVFTVSGGSDKCIIPFNIADINNLKTQGFSKLSFTIKCNIGLSVGAAQYYYVLNDGHEIYSTISRHSSAAIGGVEFTFKFTVDLAELSSNFFEIKFKAKSLGAYYQVGVVSVEVLALY